MVAVLAVVSFLLLAQSAPAIERFPPPDFTNHPLPPTTKPAAPALVWEYVDLAALAVGLGLASYLALVRRSRRGMVLLAVLALLWLGFWRKGCVCPIGAIQNVALAVADPGYAIPLVVLGFFALPLVFTLFFGRTFCAAVCPLGAVQELVVLRPVKVPVWLDHALGLLPFLYLGAAVVFAATGTMFLVCDYDPFVGFFRRSAPVEMLLLGGAFLVLGMFVGRPYCRYLCPYGAILGLLSRVSKRRLRIPPEECIKCRLCEEACPYGAIRGPTVELSPQERLSGRRRLAAMLALAPALAGLGFALGSLLGTPLSQVHPTVQLAEAVRLAELGRLEAVKDEDAPPERIKHRNDAVEAFRNTRRPAAELYAEARTLEGQFTWAGRWLGAWMGLVIGVKLIHLSVRRRRTEYLPDPANCVSCGRCFWYCPSEQVRQGLIEIAPLESDEPVAARAD